MKNLIFIAFLAISNCLFSQDTQITVTGNWMKTINASDIGEAGNDYPTTYASNLNQTLLTLDSKNKKKLVNVYVHKEDNLWNEALTLKIRRTSNGTNSSAILYDGLIYQAITNNDVVFFYCEDSPTFVPLQYEITGISVVLPVQSYSTTIIYTVMLR